MQLNVNFTWSDLNVNFVCHCQCVCVCVKMSIGSVFILRDLVEIAAVLLT